MAGLTVTPAANDDTDFELTVTATATDTDPDTGDISTETVTGTMNVVVDAQADAPTLTLTDAAGSEDLPIALNIDAGLTDDSEVLSVSISGVPAGATLSAGTYDAESDTWTVDPADLAGLTVAPPTNSNEDFTLTVTATSAESDGSTASTTSTLNVAVTGVADAPTLSVNLGEGTLVESGDATLGSVTITNMGNATAGYNNSYGYYVIGEDGTPQSGKVIWDNVKNDVGDTFTLDGVDPATIGFFVIPNGDDLNWNLQDGMDVTFAQSPITGNWYAAGPNGLPLHGAGDPVLFSDPALNEFNFDYTQDTGSPGNQNWEDLFLGGDFNFNDVNMQVDTTPGQPGGPDVVEYPLDINAALTDTDGSETLSATIIGLPADATLTLTDGTVLTSTGPDDSFDLTADQLQGITLTVPAEATDFDLSVTATATENDGDTATVGTTVAVDVPDPIADAAELDVSPATGDEDTAIPLTIDAALTDESETLSVTVSGIPDGAVLKSGDTVLVVENGQITFADGVVPDDLTITPPTDSADDFQLTVTATSTEFDGSSVDTVKTLDVTVQGVADGAQVTDTAASGAEDTAIPFTVDVSELDTDGSETLSVTLSNIPEGAVITRNGEALDVVDGQVTLGEGELDGLAILPPADFSGDFDLTVSATTTDEGDVSETALGTVSIDVTGVADGPDLDLRRARQ